MLRQICIILVLLTNSATKVKVNKQPKEEWVPATPAIHANFTDLDARFTSTLNQDLTFIAACEEMAGYYKDPTKRPDFAKVLMIVGVNQGYKDFFHNFKCFADRLGIKFLPVSLDEGIYGYLKHNDLGPTVLLGDIPGRDRVASEASGFGGKNFNLIGCRKMEAVGAALKLGYDVVFSDVDIALLRDPINDLFLSGVDYVHSVNTGCNAKWSFNDTMEGNTGFYSARSNERSIRMWDYTYRACSKYPQYDDQTMFWLILRHIAVPKALPSKSCQPQDLETTLATINPASRKDKHGLVRFISCPLDTCLYSASQLSSYAGVTKLRSVMEQRKEKAVMIHANWINGRDKKKHALLEAGLWITRRKPGPSPVGGGGADTGKGVETNRPNSGHAEWKCLEKIESVFV